LFAHDHGTTRSTKSFVCSGGDNIKNWDWIFQLFAGNKPGNMSNIGR